jgi:hypothetical protein
MASDLHRRQTLPGTEDVLGNGLFHRAAYAIGMDGAISRQLIVDILSAVGSGAHKLTIHELGAVLPEVDRRLRLLLPPDAANRSIARLRKLVLDWEE